MTVEPRTLFGLAVMLVGVALSSAGAVGAGIVVALVGAAFTLFVSGALPTTRGRPRGSGGIGHRTSARARAKSPRVVGRRRAPSSEHPMRVPTVAAPIPDTVTAGHGESIDRLLAHLGESADARGLKTAVVLGRVPHPLDRDDPLLVFVGDLDHERAFALDGYLAADLTHMVESVTTSDLASDPRLSDLPALAAVPVRDEQDEWASLVN